MKMKYRNTNEKFGMSGPWEADSREQVAGLIEDEAYRKLVEQIRAEFITGLVEI